MEQRLTLYTSLRFLHSEPHRIGTPHIIKDSVLHICEIMNHYIAMIAMSKTHKCFYVLAPNLPDDLDPCGAVNEDKYNIIIKIGAIFN